jgi:hypothetical protein
MNLELIEIATGKRVKINEFKAIMIDDFEGIIDVKLSGKISKGAYLINVNINDKNANQSIILQ